MAQIAGPCLTLCYTDGVRKQNTLCQDRKELHGQSVGHSVHGAPLLWRARDTLKVSITHRTYAVEVPGTLNRPLRSENRFFQRLSEH